MSAASFGYLTDENLRLFTDLYELKMMQGYLARDHNPRATFSLFFRSLPPDRGYAIAAGLEQAVHYLERLSFSERELAALREEGFEDWFVDYLADLEFTGDVRALPEGTPVFPNEPMLEVTAPIVEGQLFETLLINQVGFQTLVATKAARMRDAVERYGDGQSLVDFGSRRAHGTDAGLKAARAAYVGGFDGTSNVAAGEAFDIPAFGTMAHSWVQSFESERKSFEAFVDVYGEESILLVDTYDTVHGAELAAEVAEEAGVDVEGVRLDSGDLAALSREVEPIVGDMGVFVSSGVDEYAIREFFADDGVATGFGPGTALTTSSDAPKLEGVYKLVAVERDGEMAPSMKTSTGKVTHPGAKSVRRVERENTFERDVLGRRGEDGPGEDLLVTVFEDGDLVYDLPDLDDVQARAVRNLGKLPGDVRAFENPAEYDVDVSHDLERLTEKLEERLRAE